MIHESLRPFADERGIVPWSAIQAQYGDQVIGTHMHAPRTKELGVPVLSVLHNGKAIAEVTEAHLDNPRVHINRYQLEQAINNPVNPRTGKQGKTRNTLMEGIPVAPRQAEDSEYTKIVMGRGTAGTPDNPTSILSHQVEPGTVRMRTNGGTMIEGQRVTGPSRSAVFAEHVTLGNQGIRALGMR